MVVGTPGRILDFAQKGTLNLSKLKHMVLDEVDRMLEIGFAETVDEILQFAYTEGKTSSAVRNRPGSPCIKLVFHRL